MGEYAYRGRDCLKIATMDEAFWSRAELLAAQAEGWGARPDTILGRAVDELALLLHMESTLYALPPRTPRPFDMSYQPPPPAVVLYGPLELATQVEHKKPSAVFPRNCRMKYWLPRADVPEAKWSLLGLAPPRFEFLAIGERYRRGVPRTIFACAWCDALFSLPPQELARIDQTACYDPMGNRWLTLHPNRELE